MRCEAFWDRDVGCGAGCELSILGVCHVLRCRGGEGGEDREGHEWGYGYGEGKGRVVCGREGG